jgi:hypothetical protein
MASSTEPSDGQSEEGSITRAARALFELDRITSKGYSVGLSRTGEKARVRAVLAENVVEAKMDDFASAIDWIYEHIMERNQK